MLRLLAILVGFSVVACTSSFPFVVVSPAPKSAREAKPAKDVIDAAALVPRDGAGAIVITRKRTWGGTGCTFDVALDNRSIAGLRPGEQLTMYADPGARVVAIAVRDEAGCEPAHARIPLDVIGHTTSRMKVGAEGRYELKVEVDTSGGSLRD